jgi:hypothetical protein
MAGIEPTPSKSNDWTTFALTTRLRGRWRSFHLMVRPPGATHGHSEHDQHGAGRPAEGEWSWQHVGDQRACQTTHSGGVLRLDPVQVTNGQSGPDTHQHQRAGEPGSWMINWSLRLGSGAWRSGHVRVKQGQSRVMVDSVEQMRARPQVRDFTPSNSLLAKG